VEEEEVAAEEAEEEVAAEEAEEESTFNDRRGLKLCRTNREADRLRLNLEEELRQKPLRETTSDFRMHADYNQCVMSNLAK
jgi:hypothetical protein